MSAWTWYYLKPCGTTAAYRRHLRREGKPVRCESCKQAKSRENQDRPSRARGQS